MHFTKTRLFWDQNPSFGFGKTRVGNPTHNTIFHNTYFLPELNASTPTHFYWLKRVENSWKLRVRNAQFNSWKLSPILIITTPSNESKTGQLAYLSLLLNVFLLCLTSALTFTVHLSHIGKFHLQKRSFLKCWNFLSFFKLFISLFLNLYYLATLCISK